MKSLAPFLTNYNVVLLESSVSCTCVILCVCTAFSHILHSKAFVLSTSIFVTLVWSVPAGVAKIWPLVCALGSRAIVDPFPQPSPCLFWVCSASSPALVLDPLYRDLQRTWPQDVGCLPALKNFRKSVTLPARVISRAGAAPLLFCAPVWEEGWESVMQMVKSAPPPFPFTAPFLWSYTKVFLIP